MGDAAYRVIQSISILNGEGSSVLYGGKSKLPKEICGAYRGMMNAWKCGKHGCKL